MTNNPKQIEVNTVAFRQFLESTPPGTKALISDFKTQRAFDSHRVAHLVGAYPVIHLHCSLCNGERQFTAVDAIPMDFNLQVNNLTGYPDNRFVIYVCRNCQSETKTYALQFCSDYSASPVALMKIGEVPHFGPSTPNLVLKLLGKEKEYYLKGRRAENQGLGIAAYAYYRRVIENQKNHILDQIILVAEKTKAPEEIVADLKQARNEKQFSRAIKSIKHGIPQALLINGENNPLTLLHNALSDGIHNETDEQCLELAASIRLVLCDLANRMDSALKDETALNSAVNKLLKKRTDIGG